MAVRLGFRSVRGLANAHGANIAAARGPAAYESVEDVWRRAGVPAQRSSAWLKQTRSIVWRRIGGRGFGR